MALQSPACPTHTTHLFCLEPTLDPLVLYAGDGVQEAAAGELQALVEAAVGQPLPAETGSLQPGAQENNISLLNPPVEAEDQWLIVGFTGTLFL